MYLLSLSSGTIVLSGSPFDACDAHYVCSLYIMFHGFNKKEMNE